MPGVFCNGVDTDQPFVQESKAYAQGVEYRLGDTELARPKSDNPYDINERPVEHAAWNNGWDAVNGRATQPLRREDVGCAAGEGVIVKA